MAAWVQTVWHFREFTPDQSAAVLGWYGAQWALFLVWPFLFPKRTEASALPWITAAAAGLVQFGFIFDIVPAAWPELERGWIPGLCAHPPLLGLTLLLTRPPTAATPEIRNSQLAWFGGVSLFFLTMVLPVQFQRQTLTIGWALEGAALCWLYRRVPHEGLKFTGVALLATAFVRLTFNPPVFFRNTNAAACRSGNWQLYTYGLTVLALFAAIRFLAPPRHLIRDVPVRPVLQVMAGILIFILINAEIADFFTPEGSPYVSWSFSGSFARDMTVSIAWALDALALIVRTLETQPRPPLRRHRPARHHSPQTLPPRPRRHRQPLSHRRHDRRRPHRPRRAPSSTSGSPSG